MLQRIDQELRELGSRPGAEQALRRISLDLLALRSRIAAEREPAGPCLLLELCSTDCAVELAGVQGLLPFAERTRLAPDVELVEPHPTSGDRRTIVLLERGDGRRVGLVVDRVGRIVDPAQRDAPLRIISADLL